MRGCVCAEPTNHLDIPSKEMLEEAIQAFQGAVIAVSHDRYFLRKIATRILQVRRPRRAAAPPASPLACAPPRAGKRLTLLIDAACGHAACCC